MFLLIDKVCALHRHSISLGHRLAWTVTYNRILHAALPLEFAMFYLQGVIGRQEHTSPTKTGLWLHCDAISNCKAQGHSWKCYSCLDPLQYYSSICAQVPQLVSPFQVFRSKFWRHFLTQSRSILLSFLDLIFLIVLGPLGNYRFIVYRGLCAPITWRAMLVGR